MLLNDKSKLYNIKVNKNQIFKLEKDQKSN